MQQLLELVEVGDPVGENLVGADVGRWRRVIHAFGAEVDADAQAGARFAESAVDRLERELDATQVGGVDVRAARGAAAA